MWKRHDHLNTLKSDSRLKWLLCLLQVTLLASAAISMSHPNAAYEFASNQHSDGITFCDPKPADQLEAVQGLLQRLLPEYQHLFTLKIAPPDTTSSFFEIEAIDGTIDVYGTSGVEITSGINWFLKYFCNSSVSWEATGGRQLDRSSFSAERMREHELRGKVRVERAVTHSYYQNIVTMSYSFTYWDWERWWVMVAQQAFQFAPFLRRRR
jgi:hypothetical protein